MNIVIIGAGLAGSIAAGALSGYNPVVLEAGSEDSGGLSSHHAVMRVRNSDVAKYLGCNSTKIEVDKSVYFDGALWDRSTIAMDNMYSLKAYNQLGKRSLSELGTVDRHLIDDTQIKPVGVRYDCSATMLTGGETRIEVGKSEWLKYDACISTIPMMKMIELCNLRLPERVPMPSFESLPVLVATAKLNVKSTVHQTIYFPESKFDAYRATLEGKRFIVESVTGWDDDDEMTEELGRIVAAFGLSLSQFSQFKVNLQKMGKIIPIPDAVRRWVILELTNRFNVYSFGRFAIWSSIRADHLVNDIEKIKQFINMDSWVKSYETRLLQRRYKF